MEEMLTNTIDAANTTVPTDIPAVEDYNSSMTMPNMPGVMSVQEATGIANQSFGWKEAAVLGFFTVGTAAIGYSLYDLGYKKLIKGVIMKKIAEKKAMKEAVAAGEEQAEEKEE